MSCMKDASKFTQFSQWLFARRDDLLPSCNAEGGGYITTDIDFVWYNYRIKKYILLEEKTHDKAMGYPQSDIYAMMDQVCALGTPLLTGRFLGFQYLGLYIVRFENESPTDGRIHIVHGGREIEVSEGGLVTFLQTFKFPA